MTQHPILVATDFKPRSDRAVDRAVRLARETGRELVVVHAVEDENETKTGPSLQDRVASVMPEDAGSYRCLFPEGSAPRAIAQAVDEQSLSSRELARNLDLAANGVDAVGSNLAQIADMARGTGAAAEQVLVSADQLDATAHGLDTRSRQFVESVRAA